MNTQYTPVDVRITPEIPEYNLNTRPVTTEFAVLPSLETSVIQFSNMCVLYKQRDATYTMYFIIISAVHVSGCFSAHNQDLIKPYVQPCLLSCFPTFYRWCGWLGTHPRQRQTAGKHDNTQSYTYSFLSS